MKNKIMRLISATLVFVLSLSMVGGFPAAFALESDVPLNTENAAPFIKEQTTDVEGVSGNTVVFSVELASTDGYDLSYQWQKKHSAAEEENAPTLSELLAGENEVYFFPLSDMSKQELLTINPAADWDGKEAYIEATLEGETANIENGTSLVEAPAVYDEDWNDIDGATAAEFEYTIDDDFKSFLFRCVITLTPKAADLTAQETVSDDEPVQPDNPPPEEKTETEENALEDEPETTPAQEDIETEPAVQEQSVVIDSSTSETHDANSETDISEEISEKLPAETDEPTDIGETDEISDAAATEETTEAKEASLQKEPIILVSAEMRVTEPQRRMFVMAKARSASVPAVALNGSWVTGVDRTMEYITAEAYDRYSASSADDLHWTKLAGGNRADGTPYLAASVVSATSSMPVLSAWYGKTVYFRYCGTSGNGSALKIPAYTGLDYATGQSSLYKSAVSVLSVRIPETGYDFYSAYLNAISDVDTKVLQDGKGCAIVPTRVPLTPNGGQYAGISFNENAESYLRDAEGNYRYDSVMVGVCCYAEPDISGSAAWALRDYIADGYGFMTGHDTLYAYGGVVSSDYVPDRNDTSTCYYVPTDNSTGHKNMNWLIGVNEHYAEANPYDAESMILCCGDWFDKSNIYGDDGDYSTIRIAKTVSGNADTDVSLRVPTNYPYNTSSFGAVFTVGTALTTRGTHSNQQIAYGDIWVDFLSNDSAQYGFGKSVIDKRLGLGVTGTNNFYLTTNGNIALNQVGHRVTGVAAGLDELRIFANSVMYISQRMQCQVCQSAQGGNEDVHFVHKIYSAAQLAKLNDPNFWFTYPMDGCYMLMRDIVLPDDWTPINGFYGHFDADGHTVTLGANAAPLFANDTGTLGQYTENGLGGWNLGTDKTVGTNSIVARNGSRVTAVARVAGYIEPLMQEAGLSDSSYNGYTVRVFGSDGTTYSCLTNYDGKYVISNLPCTGVMEAQLVDRSGSVIIDRDKLFACIPGSSADYGHYHIRSEAHAAATDGFWFSNETTSLFLLTPSVTPVKNKTVYEGDEALMTGASIENAAVVSSVRWEFSKSNGDIQWLPINRLDGRVRVETSDDNKVSDLLITDAKYAWNGYLFRAVFTTPDGKEYNSYDSSVTGYYGKLTVLPLPIYIEDPESQTVWVDGTATFASSCEAAAGADNGLGVQWQVRRFDENAWTNVGAYPGMKAEPTDFSVANTISDGTTNPELCPYKTTSVLTVNCSSKALDQLRFRAVYTYKNPHGRICSKASGDTSAILTVKPPVIYTQYVTDQSQRIGCTFERALKIDAGKVTSSQTAIYEADIYYVPGAGESVPTTEVAWKYYKNNSAVGIVWNQTTANALAASLGAANPVVTITNSAPKKVPDSEYRVIHSTMKITSVDWRLYSDECFLQFVCVGTNHYRTSPYKTISAQTPEKILLAVDYSVGIKWNEGRKSNKTAYSDWTYPNMTVNSPSGIKTLLLYFDGSLSASHVSDRLIINGVPEGMRLAISNSRYLMLVSDEGIADTLVQDWLRNNLTVRSYDALGTNPKVRAYINGADNLGGAAGSATPTQNPVSTGVVGDGSYSGNVISIAWSNTNHVVGGTAAAHASTTAPYLQWQLNDGSGWKDASYENSPTYIIGNLMGMMDGWKLRLKYGDNETNSKLTNELTVAYAFSYTLTSSSNASGAGTSWTANGNVIYIDAAYADQITSVTFNWGVSFSYGYHAVSDNNVQMSVAGVDKNGTLVTLFSYGLPGTSASGTKTVSVNGLRSIYVRAHNFASAVIYNASSYINNIKVSGTGGGSDDGGITIRRGTHEAWDLTTVHHEYAAAPNVVAETQAADKVYDGIEQNATVTLKDTEGVLTAAQLADILKRGTIAYSSGAEVSGSGAVGSRCVDAGGYTAQFVPADTDADSFSSNDSAEIAGRTTTFTITRRPVSVYSFDNDKTYDANDIAMVVGIEAEPYNAEKKSGIIPADKTAAALSFTEHEGSYGTIHQTDGKQVSIRLNEQMQLIGEKAHNYIIVSEKYTGAINPRGLELYSRYLEPLDEESRYRNVKTYDGEVAAIISDVIILNAADGDVVELDKKSFAGTYQTKHSGETLNPDGTVMDRRFFNLVENPITRTEDVSVKNDIYGDYFIEKEVYSGAICRYTIIARVADVTVEYGTKFEDTLTAKERYAPDSIGEGSSLTIDTLRGNDELIPDPTLSDFSSVVDLAEAKDVGVYPISYDGLTEEHYPMLENYIVVNIPGSLIITPKLLTVTVLGGYSKIEGDPNPAFGYRIDGFIEGDNEQNSLDGTVSYSTLCDMSSKPQYDDSGKDIPYEITAYGLRCRLNENGFANYEIEYIAGTIIVKPRPVPVPNTGDANNILGWWIAFGVSLAIGSSAIIIWYKKKKK